MKDLASRLLELEQRFESYCSLHEQELAEIRQSIADLRLELLQISRGTPCEDVMQDFDAAADGHDQLASGSEAVDELSL